MTTRRYQMVRVKAGVYLLPSNDGRTLWRISSYVENGSAYMNEDGSGRITGTHWETARQPMPSPDVLGGASDDEAYEWLWGDDWESWSFMHRTRAEAIASVEDTFSDAA